MGRVKLSFHSGHSNNVFQAKFMPHTDDRSIVTCAADGQVRLAQIPDRGGVETSLLGSHAARAHKLAIEPGSPYSFYTSAEDGLVQHFDLRTKSATKLFTCHSIHHRRYYPYLQLNAITINPRNPNFFAVAGGDAYTRLYDIRKTTLNSSGCDQPADFFCPDHLVGDENVGITGLAFSDQSELLVSYNDEQIYLFTKEMGLGHSPATSSSSSSSSEALEAGPDSDDSPEMYRSDVNANEKSRPNCGNIFIWRKKDGELLRVMRGDRDVVNCIEPHPHTTMMASSGIESDIKIWTPKPLEKATLPPNLEEVVKHRSRFFSFDYDGDDLSPLDDEYVTYSSEDGDYNENDDDDSDGDEEEEGSADSGDDDENDGGNDEDTDSMDAYDDDNGDTGDLEPDGGNNGEDSSIPDAAAVDD
ncbi:DDB1- and CUL4-associated factor 8-like protein [Drosera capensis]